MKRIFLFLLTFTPLYAFGEYIPGRTRATAESSMTRLQGDGRYHNVKGAHAIQFLTDGRGITQFTLSFNERGGTPYIVRSVQRNRCGRTYYANVKNSKGRLSQLRVDETMPEICRRPGDTSWRATIVTDEGGGRASHLSLSGPAEFFLLTQ